MKKPFFSLLSKAINSYLHLDPDAKKRLHRLAGKVVSIELLPMQLHFQLCFNENGVQIETENLQSADTMLRGTPLQFLGMMRDKENRQDFFAEDLVIIGNAELGQQVVDLFENIEIDWEEYLSSFTGDIPAHYVGRFAQNAKNWLQQVRNSFTQNIDEYVHEEVQWFPQREALQDFFADIDTLRMDVDRAEARIKQLKQNLRQNEDEE